MKSCTTSHVIDACFIPPALSRGVSSLHESSAALFFASIAAAAASGDADCNTYKAIYSGRSTYDIDDRGCFFCFCGNKPHTFEVDGSSAVPHLEGSWHHTANKYVMLILPRAKPIR